MVDDRVVKWLLGVLAGILLAGVTTVWQSTQKIDLLANKINDITKEVDRHRDKDGHDKGINRLIIVEQNMQSVNKQLDIMDRQIDKIADKLDVILREIQRNIGPQKPGGVVR